MEEYKLFLTYIDPVDGESYSFYCNVEESENLNTRFYCGVELLSDNYFAFNELNEIVERIYLGEITEYTMFGDMIYNYQAMIEDGQFEHLVVKNEFEQEKEVAINRGLAK